MNIKRTVFRKIVTNNLEESLMRKAKLGFLTMEALAYANRNKGFVNKHFCQTPISSPRIEG